MIPDTSALAAILFGEPEATRYTHLIHDADRCLISVANFVELCMVIESQIGPDANRQCDVFFRRAGILIEPLTVERGHLAVMPSGFPQWPPSSRAVLHMRWQ